MFRFTILPRSSGCFLALFATVALGTFCTTAMATNFDVYIITGQSNSLGTTALESSPFDPGSSPVDAGTSFFWSNASASNTSYPASLYGDSGGAITTLQQQQGDNGANPTFWGPEFGLARNITPTNGSNVLIIKASRGGGGNSLWDQQTFLSNPAAGHMWGHVRDTVDQALTAVITGGDTFSVRGLVYMQGESNNTTEASLAGTRLGSFVDNLTTHINNGVASTADDMHTVVLEIAASSSNTNRSTTNFEQMNLAASRSDVTYVATNDLPLKSDGIHFGRDAKLELGARAAMAFNNALDLPNGIAGDVNQDGQLFGDGMGLANVDDVTAFRAGWLSDTTGLSPRQQTLMGDLNFSGRTDLGDAFLLHQAFQQAGLSVPLSSLVVPEPATGLSIVILATTALVIARSIRNSPISETIPDSDRE